MPIPDQSIVTYQGVWPSGLPGTGGAYLNAQQLVSDVNSSLSGLLVARTTSFDSTLLGGIPFSGLPVRIEYQVENGMGYSSVDDIIAVIRHAVYSNTGEFPSADSIPRVQAPNQAPVTTGQPGQAPPQTKGCIAGTSQDLTGSFDLACWFSNLTGKGLSAVGLLAIAAVLALVLIGRRQATASP